MPPDNTNTGDNMIWLPVLVFAAIILALIVLMGGVSRLTNNTEIGITKYTQVRDYIIDPAPPPELINKIREAMEDEKITLAEFRDIVREHRRLTTDNTKDSLVEQIHQHK